MSTTTVKPGRLPYPAIGSLVVIGRMRFVSRGGRQTMYLSGVSFNNQVHVANALVPDWTAATGT